MSFRSDLIAQSNYSAAQSMEHNPDLPQTRDLNELLMCSRISDKPRLNPSSVV